MAIYAEYDLMLPAFAWERGVVVDDDAGVAHVHNIVGLVAREGTRSAQRPDTRAVRMSANALLVETDLGRRDQVGRPTRVSIVVDHPFELENHLDHCADTVTRALAVADLSMESTRVRAALAWGMVSTRPRLPRLDALLRWALSVLGAPRTPWHEHASTGDRA
ncbi:hypothetical protein [Actinophytocola sp.]|uniref:hypothetical protein n=1 Tax=Actinophytocola sp. TaxID=1872138 RepID=UPI002ED488B0